MLNPATKDQRLDAARRRGHDSAPGPELVRDVQGLMGDAVDNVPGRARSRAEDGYLDRLPPLTAIIDTAVDRARGAFRGGLRRLAIAWSGPSTRSSGEEILSREVAAGELAQKLAASDFLELSEGFSRASLEVERDPRRFASGSKPPRPSCALSDRSGKSVTASRGAVRGVAGGPPASRRSSARSRPWIKRQRQDGPGTAIRGPCRPGAAEQGGW